MRIDEANRALDATLPVRGRSPRTVRIAENESGDGVVTLRGRTPGAGDRERLLETVRHVLRLDEDLSEFYAVAAADPQLSWVTAGAGRMVRSPTVFEDVVKTICTTNCA